MTLKELTSEIQKEPFWALSVLDVIKALQTDERNGILEEEAERRLTVFGPNVIEKVQVFSGLLIFLNQFKSPLILILLFAGVVTIWVNHYQDAIFIFAAVLTNAFLGFYQEYKAEKALAELKTYLKQRARVIRGGIEREIDVINLVPGDVVRLAQGDRSPADGRLIFVNDFQVDEAILTGEALPVGKSLGGAPLGASLGDQRSMIFAGTLITQGIGTMVVCRTDFATELGKIALLVAQARVEKTPLEKSIQSFSMRASIFLGVLTAVIFGVGLAFGYPRLEMFLISVAIAVSAVPEGLPVAMTVILAVGVQRMAARKGVIRKMTAAETLGSATIILTDKTGTLTMAKMELDQVLPEEGEDERRLLELALINTNILIENHNASPLEWRMSGRVLEMSLARSAALRGIDVEEVKNKTAILSFLPFNAVNKFSVSLVRDQGKHILVFLGAPDIFINHSVLSAEIKEEFLAKINSLAGMGKLVIGVATKEVEVGEDFIFSRDLKVTHLNFKGLISLHDPIRPSVKDAIHRVQLAGIKIVIVTGDHRGTAEAVAREVGLLVKEGGILDAVELSGLSNEELKKRLPSLQVISRVSPFDKMRIVKAFQEIGEVVAMTGDGVNDAPSIKQADIGIAMGSGTEVARDVADLVILDDNFETIAAAVEEGRQIMNNIRKVLVYLLSSVADELLLISGALLAGIALPFNALQILWINFFSDSFPAVAFAFEKNVDGFSKRSFSGKVGLFNPLMKFLILFRGGLMSAFLFLVYWILLYLGFGEDLVRTFIFASFGTYSLLLAFPVRNLNKSIFQYPAFSNHYLVLGVSIGMALMAAAIYLPFLQSIFKTVALSPYWLLGVVLMGILNIATMELGKWMFGRRQQ